jgi:hypothetical protein
LCCGAYSVWLFFLIDGLDEFQDEDWDEEESQELELVGPLRILHSSLAVKLCVSSRPHNAFRQEFGSDPRRCFKLQDLTREDTQAYIHNTLAEARPSGDEGVHSDDPYFNLIKKIADAAEGVFLWVHLAVRSLREGICNRDPLHDLQKRLRRLPQKLELLFDHILATVPSAYKVKCARSLLIATAPSLDHAISPLYLHLFSDEEEMTMATQRDVFTMSELSELSKAVHDMAPRLKALCGGLLDAHLRGSIVLDRCPGKHVDHAEALPAE